MAKRKVKHPEEFEMVRLLNPKGKPYAVIGVAKGCKTEQDSQKIPAGIPEKPIMGTKNIAAFIGVHQTTLLYTYLEEMVEAGVVLPRTDKTVGSRVTTKWWSWPSLIQRWVILRGGIGQHHGCYTAQSPTSKRLLEARGFQANNRKEEAREATGCR